MRVSYDAGLRVGYHFTFVIYPRDVWITSQCVSLNDTNRYLRTLRSHDILCALLELSS